jgi:hypothetical protein
MPLKITGTKMSLDPFGILAVKGCLAADSSYPQALPLRIQYRVSTGGTWRTLAAVHAHLTGGHCGSGGLRGSAFSNKVLVAVASAYYRLSYAGSADWEPAVSAVAHEAKTLTKITSFTVSPKSVPANGYVTVSGRLWKDHQGWHPLAGQHVWILFYYKGAWYYYISKPLTNSSGWFKGTFQPVVSAPWIAEYMGGSSYFASTSGSIKVTVTGTSRGAHAYPFHGQLVNAGV